MNARIIPFLLTFFVASPALASDAITKAVNEIAPGQVIERVEASPIAGFKQAIVSGQVLYVSNDGRYVMHGSLYDTKEQRDLTASLMDQERKAKLDTLKPEGFISFAPTKPKHRVTVFTDIDCGYCRQMHSQIDEYNAQGIQVDYLFYPRSGPGSHSFAKAVSVWCADDPNAAMTLAKSGEEPKPATCTNPVANDFAFGHTIDVAGTPAIYTDQGVKVGGYLPPERLLAVLEGLAPTDKSD